MHAGDVGKARIDPQGFRKTPLCFEQSRDLLKDESGLRQRIGIFRVQRNGPKAGVCGLIQAQQLFQDACTVQKKIGVEGSKRERPVVTGQGLGVPPERVQCMAAISPGPLEQRAQGQGLPIAGQGIDVPSECDQRIAMIVGGFEMIGLQRQGAQVVRYGGGVVLQRGAGHATVVVCDRTGRIHGHGPFEVAQGLPVLAVIPVGPAKAHAQIEGVRALFHDSAQHIDAAPVVSTLTVRDAEAVSGIHQARLPGKCGLVEDDRALQVTLPVVVQRFVE